MKDIWVVGSINMDLVAECPRFVLPGETITGSGFSVLPGGKGANQAVALARLGARPRMAGRVGDDAYGDQYLEVFAREGVDASAVGRAKGVPTGIALIEVAASGENRILVIPGANHAIGPEDVDAIAARMGKGDIVLLQLELRLETVLRAVAAAKARGAVVVLDPAPALRLPASALKDVDFITPNEVEAGIVAGVAAGEGGEGEESFAREAASRLLDAGVGTVIQKAGGSGAYVADRGGARLVEAFAVDVVDTTGAGDSFNAGFAFALARGGSTVDAARFANAVGALSTTAKGAQSAMPSLAAAERLLAARNG